MLYYQEKNIEMDRQVSEAYHQSYPVRRANNTHICPSLRIFQPGMNDNPLQVSIETLRALLTQSPHLARVFQARWLLYHSRVGGGDFSNPKELFFIRILLDLSWIDMRVAICSLRPILGEEPRKFREMLLVLPTLCSEIYPESFTSRDLALGFLRLMRKICCGDLSLEIWRDFKQSKIPEWGRHVRSSPHSSPELLHELHERDVFCCPSARSYGGFETDLHPIEFHDVVEWLKASPDSPVDLIKYWTGYLGSTDEDLEYSSRCRRANKG
ncbi:hypothetical protein B0H19DRAFT_1152689 [Mycena capillaripes]|nr:hypothetical protein B0H19DRAFT_1152689 [Mycena capillaripes]